MAVTILDIAHVAKVSHTTVSRALNDNPLIAEKTRKRIKKIAEEMHYVPNMAAKNLVASQSGNILLLVSEGIASYPASFSYEIMDGINSVLPGRYTLVYRKVKSMQTLDNLIASIHFDGIMFVYLMESDMEIIMQLASLNVPFAVLNRNTSDIGVSCVYANEHKGVLMGMEYLISLGHTRIAHIQGPGDIVSTRLRCSAYLSALKQHNIPFVKEYLKQGNFQPETGLTATEELLALPNPPTAIFAANDLTAVGVLKACAANMKPAPDHISVMGFDDMEFSTYLIPSLTTIRKSKRKIGSEGAAIMMQLIENADGNVMEVALDLELICRESCIRCV